MKYQWALFMAVSWSVVLHFAADWSGAFFYLGFPGMATNLRITGGHGGTRLEDTLGLFAEIIVNAVIYSAIIWLAANKAEKWKSS